MKISCRNAILASRLIRSSEQLEAVKSAIEDPINTELVKQLESYLDPEAKKLLNDAEEAKSKAAEKAVEDITGPDDAADAESDSGFGGMGGGRSIPDRFSGRPSAPMDMETPDLPGDFESEETEETEVESSSTVYGKPVTAASDIQQSDVADKVTSLKGYLNANSSTAGADRIVIKDDELWIHFNDSINLNNTMIPVIEYMTNPYPWLAFNRLARSENAMVFTINFADQFDRDDSSEK